MFKYAFKIEILSYADNIDPIASKIGSANTVLHISNKLFVYNTDWIGVKDFVKYELGTKRNFNRRKWRI